MIMIIKIFSLMPLGRFESTHSCTHHHVRSSRVRPAQFPNSHSLARQTTRSTFGFRTALTFKTFEMSLVVRPQRAKKAVDYAALANGSVEDAEEPPPPQPGGKGKRKLEETGASSEASAPAGEGPTKGGAQASKAAKGKAPASKAPSKGKASKAPAGGAPALVIDRDTDLEPLSPETQAKLLALFREAEDQTARWRPPAQTLLASIRSKMVVRAEQSYEYSMTRTDWVRGDEPGQGRIERTEELYTRTETADMALLRILNPAATHSIFAYRHTDLLVTHVRSCNARKTTGSGGGGGGGGASSDTGVVREASHIHILGDESLTSVLLKKEYTSYGSKVGGKALERVLRSAGIPVYGDSEQTWYFPLMLAIANDARDKGWLNNEAATVTQFTQLRAALRRVQSAQGIASTTNAVAPGFSLFEWRPKCDYLPHGSQKKKTASFDANETLKAALRGLGIVLERKAPKRMALSSAQAAHAATVVGGAQTEGESAPLAFFDGRIMVPAEAFRLVLDCLANMKETRAFSPATRLQRALIVAVPVVARSWLAASADPSLHKRIDMVTGNHNRKLALTTLCQVLRRPKFSLVESLSFGSGIKLGKKGVATFAAACPHLKSFTWLRPPSGRDLEQIMQSCPNIQDLSCGTWDVPPVRVAALINQYGGQLRQLDLNPPGAYQRFYVSNSMVRAIGDNCTNLLSLSLSNQECVRDHIEPGLACDGLSEDSVIHMLNRCTRLTRLELWKTRRIGARTLQAIVGHLRATPRTTALSTLIVRDLPVFEYATPEAAALLNEFNELLDSFTCRPAPLTGTPSNEALPPILQYGVNYNETGVFSPGYDSDEYGDY